MKHYPWLFFILCCLLVALSACRPAASEVSPKPLEAPETLTLALQGTGPSPTISAPAPITTPGTPRMTKPRTPTPAVLNLTVTRPPTITLPAETATLPATRTPASSPTPTQVPYLLDTKNSINFGASPDGAWQWSVLDQPTEDRVLYTQFVSADGKREWRIRPSEDDPVRMEFQNRYYQPFFWLPAEPYVYLVGQSCCVDGPFFYLTGMALARLNLETGQLSAWPSTWEVPFTYSFAPSGKYLLSTYPGAQAVQVTRLRDSHTITVPLPERFSQAGLAQWSPESKYVTLFACDTQEDFACEQTPILLIDPEKSEFATIVSDVEEALGGQCWIEWADETHVVLIGPDYDLVYDVEKGQLTKREK